MKTHQFPDDEDKRVIGVYKRGEFKPVKDQKRAKRTAVKAAKRYLRKDAQINIRLSSADLDMLKHRAVEEGLPYQSLVASVLHKFVSDSVPRARQMIRNASLKTMLVRLDKRRRKRILARAAQLIADENEKPSKRRKRVRQHSPSK